MIRSRSFSGESSPASRVAHACAADTDSAVTDTMLHPSTSTDSDCGFNRRPPHCGQGTAPM